MISFFLCGLLFALLGVFLGWAFMEFIMKGKL